jgi:hypothetical protein
LVCFSLFAFGILLQNCNCLSSPLAISISLNTGTVSRNGRNDLFKNERIYVFWLRTRNRENPSLWYDYNTGVKFQSTSSYCEIKLVSVNSLVYVLHNSYLFTPMYDVLRHISLSISTQSSTIVIFAIPRMSTLISKLSRTVLIESSNACLFFSISDADFEI